MRKRLGDEWREGREKKQLNNVPQCQRLLASQRYRGGSLYAAFLPLAYAKRLFPDLNP